MIAIVLGTRPRSLSYHLSSGNVRSRISRFTSSIPASTIPTKWTRVFFDELELPGSQYNLDVGSGSPAE